jgi:hypothetical protein
MLGHANGRLSVAESLSTQSLIVPYCGSCVLPIPLAVEKCQNFLAWNFGGSPTKIRDYELNNRISDSYKILILDIRIFNIQYIKILPPSFLIYLYIFAELKTPPCNYISITITKLGDKFLIYSISGIFKYEYKFWLLL